MTRATSVKAAIVSHVLPPTWSGQAIVLERLLRTFDPEKYVLILTTPAKDRAYGYALPGKLIDISTDPRSRRVVVGRIRLLLGLRTLRERTRRIVEIATAESCDVVVGCTGGDLLDIPTAFRASRRLRVRFVAYYFDYWSQQSLSAMERRAAEWIEGRVLPRADAVIVPNEFLAQALRDRYGVACTVVRNSCEAAPRDRAGYAEGAARNTRSVVYTGAVYEANIDAFRNLIAAIDSARLDAKLHIFSAQSERDLANYGLSGPLEVHEHRPAREVLDVQRSADVLFLPLGFQTRYPRIIRTSSPAKMCEYLGSGRPILVHAPPRSFVAEYFREYGCGVVVDEPDPALLGDALRRLFDDEDLRSSVIDAARKRARADYDVETSRVRFARVLGLKQN